MSRSFALPLSCVRFALLFLCPWSHTTGRDGPRGAGPLCPAPWSCPWHFWQPGLALGMRGHSWGCLFPLAWESLLALPWVREQRAQRGVRSWVGCRGTPAGFEVFPFADGSEVRFRVCQGAARQTDLPWLSARGCGTVPRSPHSPNLGGISNGQRREP